MFNSLHAVTRHSTFEIIYYLVVYTNVNVMTNNKYQIPKAVLVLTFPARHWLELWAIAGGEIGYLNPPTGEAGLKMYE